MEGPYQGPKFAFMVKKKCEKRIVVCSLALLGRPKTSTHARLKNENCYKFMVSLVWIYSQTLRKKEEKKQ